MFAGRSQGRLRSSVFECLLVEQSELQIKRFNSFMEDAVMEFQTDFGQARSHSDFSQHHSSSSNRGLRSEHSESRPMAGATAVRREYDILLAIPGQLAAEAMEWTLKSCGQVRRVRSVQTIEELNDVINSDWPRILLLDEDFATSHLQAISRNLSIRLNDCIVGLFADRLSSRQLHIAANYVSGLLSRKTSVPEFMSELDSLNDERKVVARSLQDRVTLDARKRNFSVASVEKIQNLTNRQLEVLVRIAQGMSARQAATDMHITEKAVESHKYRLMRSLGLKDRIDLCRWAIREGIVDA